jgi:hypothetical protein
MKNRRFRPWMVFSFIVLLGMLPIAIWLLRAWAGSSNNLSKIELGMTEQQVETIFGRPADGGFPELFQDFYAGTPCRLTEQEGEDLAFLSTLFQEEPRSLRSWRYPERQGAAMVLLDSSGKVIGKAWCDWGPPKKSFLETLRSWLGF